MQTTDPREPPVDDDVSSDPGRDEDSGWTAEGGATPDGPATDVPAADVPAD